MKKSPLFITLGLITLIGTCNVANSGTPDSEINPVEDSSVILESTEETTAEGINVELEEPNLEVDAEIPLVDGSEEGLESSEGELKLEDSTIGAEENPDLEANEINPDAEGEVILPATENVEIPADAESAEIVKPAEEIVPVE